MNACIRDLSSAFNQRIECPGSVRSALFFVILLIVAGLSPGPGWAQVGDIIFADKFGRLPPGPAFVERVLVYRQIAESPVAIQRM